MNKITLSPDICEKCWEFARGVIERFEKGEKDASLAYTTHGYDKDTVGWANSKMAECAFALWAGLDENAVSFGEEPDIADVIVGKTKVQVKRTKKTSTLLMWPETKVKRFDDEDFHVLVLVKGYQPEFEITGWCSKGYFKRRHTVSDGSKVSVGSWILDQDMLHKMQTFPGRSADPWEHYCWCGEWGCIGINGKVFCGAHGPLRP